ncbi:hypothetical protein A8144_10885 [Mycobacterium leprae 3125609]|uniref:Uncharacterized protein MLCB458.04c n=1 Tax=Mycobacterium leprae TaxID=1769 RepID=Q9X7E0_MYCLR|nr:hypothetical protein [Mycobacterium leprae]OAR20408.1 hypothetical protein A8144_10885 [Mycobacterium leprae 3125609]OAX70714.1 hypothetical protein A3216_10345 [Mycobacterium leprae 7935681]CAB39569.1 hypothetical protein MLCB458.04c [Mycobacterium leprae]
MTERMTAWYRIPGKIAAREIPATALVNSVNPKIPLWPAESYRRMRCDTTSYRVDSFDSDFVIDSHQSLSIVAVERSAQIAKQLAISGCS